MLESGKLEIPEARPWETVELPLPTDLSQYHNHEEEVFLHISFTLKEATKWAPASHKIAWFQHKISVDKQPTIPAPPPSTTEAADVKESRTEVEISGAEWTITFDHVRGYITKWCHGTDLLEMDKATRGAIYPCFWRAPTDNDKDSAVGVWKDYGVHRITSQLRSFQVQKGADDVTVKTVAFLAPPVLGWGYDVVTEYRVSYGGVLSMKVDLNPKGVFPKDIPRIGLNLRLPKKLDQVEWFGRGPGESYPDKKHSQAVGVWSSSVDGLEVPYDVPQGHGNRMDSRWVRVVDGNGHGIRASRRDESTFDWTGSRLSDDTIEKAKHPCDLIREEATLLNLSAKVAGVGSATCGPGVREDLKVKVEPTSYEFVLERI